MYCSFKWKSSLCALGKPFICGFAPNDCPSGFVSLTHFKSSCFKALDDPGTPVIELEGGVAEQRKYFSDAKVKYQIS